MSQPLTLFSAIAAEPTMTAGQYVKAGFFMCLGWRLMSLIVATIAVLFWAMIFAHVLLNFLK